jgi:hypothetical protein
MRNGTKPTRINHKDYDLFKTFGMVAVPAFPAEYFCDAGLTMPNQNQVNDQFNPPVPPMPEGCTDYAQSEIATDLKGELKNPAILETVTNANAKGGIDIRVSLSAAKGLGWFTAFFNIIAKAPLDYFDAFRLAQISGAPEKRSISWGTPWFPSWELAAQQGVAIMPMPTSQELANVATLPWHNHKLDGFTSKNGVLVYRDKSWQGSGIGENGFIFFPREVINVVMTISGTVAYTATDMDFSAPQRIDTTVVQWIVSLIRNLIGL